jgi:hypothetical protein
MSDFAGADDAPIESAIHVLRFYLKGKRGSHPISKNNTTFEVS